MRLDHSTAASEAIALAKTWGSVALQRERSRESLYREKEEEGGGGGRRIPVKAPGVARRSLFRFFLVPACSTMVHLSSKREPLNHELLNLEPLNPTP